MFRRPLRRLFKIVEKEPSSTALDVFTKDDVASVRKRIELARRRKFALLGVGQQKNGVATDVTSKRERFANYIQQTKVLQEKNQHDEMEAEMEANKLRELEHSWGESEEKRRRGGGGLDWDCFQTSAASPSTNKKEIGRRHLRRKELMESLEGNQNAFRFEIENAETEEDLDLGGLPSDEFHGDTTKLVISEHSALNSAIVSKNPLLDKSRGKYRSNTWSMIGSSKHGTIPRDTVDEKSQKKERNEVEREEVEKTSMPSSIGRSSYDPYFAEGINLDHQQEFVYNSISIYTKKKLYIGGLSAYHEMITEDEERKICSELMSLLLHPTVEFIPDEQRYCCNIFEEDLGLTTARGRANSTVRRERKGEEFTSQRAASDDVSTEDGTGRASAHHQPLAFGLDHSPVLKHVFHRCVALGLVPSMPNTIQVNEMTGPYSGYPVHRKHPSIGKYFGILNLVSKCVLQLSHIDQPWKPKLLMQPRGLYLFQEPCLSAFGVGYSNKTSIEQTFRFNSRHTKDYRLEVMFATVDVMQMPYLADAVRLTQYAVTKNRKTDRLQIESSDPYLGGGTQQKKTDAQEEKNEQQTKASHHWTIAKEDESDPGLNALRQGLRKEEIENLATLKMQVSRTKPVPFSSGRE